MRSLILNDNSPKVFGYLYVAVFSNGTVKAGRSARDPQGRVTTHANSGKAFDIHLDSAFYASIYTNDASTREKLMHQELGLLARLTTGKEWFKFEDATAAVNFASAYLCKVERMSFAERPSVEEIDRQTKASSKALEGLFPFAFPPPVKTFTLPAPATESELAALASVMEGYSLSVNASIANNIVSLEEQIADRRNGEASNTPILSDVINAHFFEHEKKFELTGKLLTAEDEACLDEILKNGHPFSQEVCIKIIQAAAHYPEFFYEAMGFKVAA